ncbi:MAG: M16 family metallopeptidase [Planctomycetota bacterium]
MKGIELQIDERQLGNGFCALAVQNPGVETMAAGVSLRLSQVDEKAGEEGLAHLVGNCLDEGSKKRDDLAMAKATEDLGAGFDGHSNGGSIHGPAEHSAKILSLLREFVLAPAFPARNVRRVKSEVLSAILEEDDDARSVARRRFYAEVYAKHPLARPQFGSAGAVESLSPARLRRFHERWYRPAQGYLVMVGPDPVSQSLDALEKRFSSVKKSGQERLAHPDPSLAAKSRELHIPMKREQVHVFLGHIGIRREHPDFYALLVMDHILGTGPGFTSRISKRLRDDEGLCYSVNAEIAGSAGVHPGTFSAYIGTSAEHRQKAIDGFLEEMRRMQDSPPSAEELSDVQEYLTGSFVLHLERNLSLANYAISTKRFGLGFDYLLRYPDIIRSVTRDDVQRVAQTHLHPDRVVIVSAGSGKAGPR